MKNMTVSGFLGGQMEIVIKGTESKGRKMGWVFILFMMVCLIMVSLLMICIKGLELLTGRMEVSMKGVGKTGKKMDVGCIVLRMEGLMMANMWMM